MCAAGNWLEGKKSSSSSEVEEDGDDEDAGETRK